MNYLVAYDIQNSKKRKKVANELEGIGYRVNKSVFECKISKSRLKKLEKFLIKMADKSSDSIRIYRICENCLKHSKSLLNNDEIFQSPSLYI